MKNIYVVCLVVFFFALLPIDPTSASNQTAAPSIVRCDVQAYVIDGSATGLNVRSGPGNSYKVIGNLPNQKVEGIGVHITGASGEWLRIDKATEQGGERDRIFFHGEGWVFASLLGASGMAISNGGTNLYQQMSDESPVVVRIPGGDDAVKLQGCRGKWMYVEYKNKKGWAAPGTLCANSLTTCV